MLKIKRQPREKGKDTLRDVNQCSLLSQYLQKLAIKAGRFRLSSIVAVIFLNLFLFLPVFAAIAETPPILDPSSSVARAYQPVQADRLPDVGLLTPLLSWAQTGHWDSLALTSQQLGWQGALRAGVTFSRLAGTFYTAQYLFPFSERIAFNALGEYGHGQTRLSGTLGFGITPLAQMKLTMERLSQRLPFSYASGDITARVSQGAFGWRFQQQFEHPFFQNFNGGAYYARAQSKDLSPLVFTSNGSNCGLYGAVGLQCINYRRIAGAISSGFDWGTELLLTSSTLLGGNLYYDQVMYDTRLTGDGSHDSDGLGGSLKISQLLGKRLKFSGEASVRKIYDSFQGSLSWLPPFKAANVEVALSGEHVISHNETANNNSVSLQARWVPEGVQNYETAFRWKAKPSLDEIVEWVKTPAVYMKQVLAVAEQITRLLAPSLAEITPNNGPFAGGNEVTITGTNFVKGLAVFFGGQLATAITVLSSTSLTAIVPPALSMAGSPVVDVVLQNPDGQQAVISRGYTYGGGMGQLFAETPADAVHDIEQQAVFTSAAKGGLAPYRYQWQVSTDYGYNFTNIRGATGPTYTTPPLSSDYNGYQYRMAFLDTNDNGNVSEAAVLIVDQALITSNPLDVIADEDRSALFETVTEEGTWPYYYQWQMSPGVNKEDFKAAAETFTDIEGAHESTYVTPPLTAENNGSRYRVVVTDKVGGRVFSEAATLKVGARLEIVPTAAIARNEDQQATFHQEVEGGIGNYHYQWQVRLPNETEFHNVSTGEGGTTDTYTTAKLDVADNGREYRLVVSDETGNKVYGKPIALTVNAHLKINSSPGEVHADLGAPATFMVIAEAGSTPYHYQWQWSPISHEAFVDIPNSDSWTYITPPVSWEDSKKHYQVVVTDQTGERLTSGLGNIVVHINLQVTTPDDLTRDEGQTATFTTSVIGGVPAYQFQWQMKRAQDEKFADVNSGEGGTSASYTTGPLALSDQGNQYRVVVRDEGGGYEASTPATLTMNAPLVTSRPKNALQNEGQVASFYTKPGGGTYPFTYQWQVKHLGSGEYIDAENNDPSSATYTTLKLAVTDDGNEYRVKVSDAAGAEFFSDFATLTVNRKLAATALEDAYREVNNRVSFQTQASEGTPSYTYQWQLRRAEEVEFQNLQDETSDHYTTPVLALADAGSQYRVVVRDQVDDEVMQTATLSVNAALKISQDPKDVAKNINQEASFMVETQDGFMPFHYEWQENNGNGFQTIPAAADGPFYVTPPLSLRDSGKQFQVIVTDKTGLKLISQPATLTVHANLSATQPKGIVQDEEQTAEFTIEAMNGTPPYDYQWQVREEAKTSFHNVEQGSGDKTAKYTTAPLQLSDHNSQYRVVVGDKAQDEIIAGPAILRVNGKLFIDEAPQPLTRNEKQTASFAVRPRGGTKPYTYIWEVKQGAGGFVEIAGANSFLYTTQPLTVAQDNGNQYKVTIKDAKNASVTSVPVGLTVNPELTAIAEPIIAYRNEKQMANFTVKVSGGTYPFDYQWQENLRGQMPEYSDVTQGDGGKTPHYLTPELTPSAHNEMHYQVIVQDPTGAKVTVGPVFLYVADPLVIAYDPQNTTQTVSQTAVFGVKSQGGTAPFHYQWQRRTQEEAQANFPFHDIPETEGHYFEYNYETPNLNKEDDGSEYRVVITDATPYAKVTSASATLSVRDQLTTTTPKHLTLVVGEEAKFTTITHNGIEPYTYQWQKASEKGDFTAIEPNGTSDSYTIPQVTAVDGNHLYRVVVTDQTQASTTSLAALLDVREKLTATLKDQVKNVGQKATLEVDVRQGIPPYGYQWQVSTSGGEFVNIEGAKQKIYQTKPLDVSDSSSRYQVVVSDQSHQEAVTTNIASVKVNLALLLTITTDPRDHTIDENDTFYMQVQAEGGSGEFNYQWQQRKGDNDFTTIENAESDGYLSDPLHHDADDGSQYQVVVSDKLTGQSQSSEVITVQVNKALASGKPRDVTRNEGQSADFSTLTENGTEPYQYQWLYSKEGSGDFTPLPAPNDGPFYSFLKLTEDDNGKIIKVMVTDRQGYAVEQTALLKVNKPLIVTGPLSEGTKKEIIEKNTGQKLELTVKAIQGTPDEVTKDYQYQWQRFVSEKEEFGNLRGENAAIFTIDPLNKSEYNGSAFQAQVTDAANDIKYSGAVTLIMYDELRTTVSLNEVKRNATQGVDLPAVRIDGGSGKFTYQWLKGDTPLAGKTTLNLHLDSLQTTDAGDYKLQVKDTSTGDLKTSEKITLTVYPELLSGLPKLLSWDNGESTQLQAKMTGGSGNFTYEWFKKEVGDGSLVPTTINTDSYPITNANKDKQSGAEYEVVITDTVTGDIKRAKLTLTINDPLEVTGLTDQTTNAGIQVTFAPVVSKGTKEYHYNWLQADSSTGPYGSAAEPNNKADYKITPSTSGTKYYQVEVSDDGGGKKSSQAAKLTVRPKLEMKNSPQSQSRDEDKGAHFEVTIQGGDTSNYVYKWQFQQGKSGDFKDIGSNSSSYSITTVKKTDAGNYRVLVSDGSGQTVGEEKIVELKVGDKLEITQQPQNVGRQVGDSANFYVGTRGGIDPSNNWYLGGSAIDNSYRLTAADNGKQYYVKVTDSGGGEVTSTSATVTIIYPIGVTISPANPTIDYGSSIGLRANTTNGSGTKQYQWTQGGSNVGTSINYNTGTLYGNTQFKVSVSDDTGTASDTVTVTVRAKPPEKPGEISLSPTSGPTTGGTPVTISGSNFVGGATVSFGGSSLSASVQNSWKLTLDSPTHATAEAVSVQVTNPNGDKSGTAQFTYTATAPAPGTVTPVTSVCGGEKQITCGSSTLCVDAKDTEASYVNNTCSKKGWHLPSIDEAKCLINNRDLLGLQNKYFYWTSDKKPKTAGTYSVTYFTPTGIGQVQQYERTSFNEKIMAYRCVKAG